MKSIPFLLIYTRIVVAVIIGFLAFYSKSVLINYWIVGLMVFGLLTDVFDGIVARKLNVSSEKLRIWDSNVDQFFWLVVISSIFYLNFPFIQENYWGIVFIAILEFCCYVISYLKFRKPIATHSIFAKLWTLSLLAFLIDLTINNTSSIAFFICIVLGVISRSEIILIVLTLKKWTTDIPSIFVVSKINNGIPIKKNTLFNG